MPGKGQKDLLFRNIQHSIQKIVIFASSKSFICFRWQKIESHILNKLFEKENYEYFVHSW